MRLDRTNQIKVGILVFWYTHEYLDINMWYSEWEEVKNVYGLEKEEK